jgi:hypothetical protein
MVEKTSRYRPWRFGLAGLLAFVAVAAIVAAFWNPFAEKRLTTDFLAIDVGTSREVIVERFGEPSRRTNRTKSTELWYYDVDDGWVVLLFVDGQFWQLDFFDVRKSLDDLPFSTGQAAVAARGAR